VQLRKSSRSLELARSSPYFSMASSKQQTLCGFWSATQRWTDEQGKLLRSDLTSLQSWLRRRRYSVPPSTFDSTILWRVLRNANGLLQWRDSHSGSAGMFHVKRMRCNHELETKCQCNAPMAAPAD